MSHVERFMKEALPQFESRITDLFFSFVQSDKSLMKQYLDTVAATGDLRVVNSQIAQRLRERFGLNNTGIRNSEPESSLIQSYSELEIKEKDGDSPA